MKNTGTVELSTTCFDETLSGYNYEQVSTYKVDFEENSYPCSFHVHEFKIKRFSNKKDTIRKLNKLVSKWK